MRILWLTLLAACGGSDDKGGGDDTNSSPSDTDTGTVQSTDTDDTDTDVTDTDVTDTDTTPTGDSGTVSTNCTYPPGAVEPMAEGEVITPYAWMDARHLDGRTASLELEKMPCNTDDDIDWSPFDVLLFVSIPAW